VTGAGVMAKIEQGQAELHVGIALNHDLHSFVDVMVVDMLVMDNIDGMGDDIVDIVAKDDKEEED